MKEEFDIAVLGGGPAGYPAAIRASQLGASVCLIEKGPLGGVCLNEGCIPTKAMHAVAHLMEMAGKAQGSEVDGKITPAAKGLYAHKAKVVEGLVSGVEKLLKGRKVSVVRGEGRINGPGVIEVEGHGTVKAGRIVLATGSSEIELPGLPFDGKRVISSRDLLDLGRIPSSMLIVGGGVIGCEFASIFSALGCEVTIVEMLPSLIATEDAQVSRFLQTFFRKKGIKMHLSSKVERVEPGTGSATAFLEGSGSIEADVVLVSVGRKPSFESSGAGEAGIEATRKGITVNARMETNVEGIYAAGDVIGGWLLAHVATREGIIAAENALGESREIDYSLVPTTIYTLPEVSRVGLTEKEAAEKGIDVKTGRFPFAANGKAKGLREEDGFVKWVASAADSKLLGLHIIGPHATELLPAGVLALSRGMDVTEFTSVMFAHPTLSEALGEAAESLDGRAIHLL